MQFLSYKNRIPSSELQLKNGTLSSEKNRPAFLKKTLGTLLLPFRSTTSRNS